MDEIKKEIIDETNGKSKGYKAILKEKDIAPVDKFEYTLQGICKETEEDERQLDGDKMVTEEKIVEQQDVEIAKKLKQTIDDPEDMVKKEDIVIITKDSEKQRHKEIDNLDRQNDLVEAYISEPKSNTRTLVKGDGINEEFQIENKEHEDETDDHDGGLEMINTEEIITKSFNVDETIQTGQVNHDKQIVEIDSELVEETMPEELQVDKHCPDENQTHSKSINDDEFGKTEYTYTETHGNPEFREQQIDCNDKKLEILENKKVIPGQEPSTKDIVTNLESNENIMEDSENKLVNDQNESDLRDLTVSENCPCCEETNFDIHEVVENGYTEPTSIVYNLKNNNKESTIKRKQSRETIWLAPKLIVTETVDHNDIQSGEHIYEMSLYNPPFNPVIQLSSKYNPNYDTNITFNIHRHNLPFHPINQF